MSSVSDIDNDNEYQRPRIGKSYIERQIQKEDLWSHKHTIITVSSEYIKIHDGIVEQIPEDAININFDLTNQSSQRLNSFITCSKIESIVIGKHVLWLKDNARNQLIFTLDPFVEHSLKLNTDSWIRLINAIEYTLFPLLVNIIIIEIYSKGSFQIGDIFIYLNGVNFSNKFVDIENVSCNLNMKDWEVKVSNRKNIFHRKTLSTSNPNVVILPYLIEHLRKIAKL